MAGQCLRLKFVVLLDQGCGALAEFGAVAVGPPIHHVAVAVVFGTLVVESVPDLVPDDGSDSAVVGCVVGLGVEERRLQNGCGKDDFVHPGVVVGVDGLRRHEPFVAIDRSAELVEITLIVGFVAAAVVAEQIVGGDVDARVVAPAVGVADLGGELVQLVQGFAARLRAHPFELGDVAAVGLGEVVDEHLHACLRVRREVAFDVELADGLAEDVLYERDAALPALAVLLGSGQRRSVERKVLVDECAGQERGPGMDDAPREPRLPRLDVLRRPQGHERVDERWLAHDDLGELFGGAAEAGNPCGPIESGLVLHQSVELDEVVALLGVAPGDDVPVARGDLVLEIEHRLRVVLDAAEREHLRDVRDVARADVGVLVLAVVRLVGQADSGLAEVHQVAVGSLGVGVDVVSDTAADSGALQRAENACERDQVGRIGNGGELVGDRGGAELFGPVGVHEAREQVADLLCVATGGRIRGRRFFDDGLYIDLGAVVQRPERTVDGAVGGNAVVLQPFAVDVHEEVVLRACVLVLVAEIDARVHY
ncbi:unannotated protein [freshwater metagenome]|uniref:Unannotated protein n=1 Tax=freshwater metagenome TaxID=449393 RepID=A0A6J7IRN3_9ZZZZ